MELVERNAFELVGRWGATADELRAGFGDVPVVEYRDGDRLFVGVQVDAGTHPPAGLEAELVYPARWVRSREAAPFERLEAWAIDRGHEPEGVTLSVGDERWVRLAD